MFRLDIVSLLDILFLQCGLQKLTFQVANFRIECTMSLSRLAKVLKLISLCNLHPPTKELFSCLLESCFPAKTAQYFAMETSYVASTGYCLLQGLFPNYKGEQLVQGGRVKAM